MTQVESEAGEEVNESEVLMTAAEIIKRKVGTVIDGARGRKFTPEIAQALMNAGLLCQAVELLESLAEASETD